MDPKIKSVLENIAIEWGFPFVSYDSFVSNGKMISCLERTGEIRISRTGDFNGTKKAVYHIIDVLKESGYRVESPIFSKDRIVLDCTIQYRKQK